ncbi:hypothetical protein Q604_UNBC07901G0001, partial [human gut metagenome]
KKHIIIQFDLNNRNPSLFKNKYKIKFFINLNQNILNLFYFRDII